MFDEPMRVVLALILMAIGAPGAAAYTERTRQAPYELFEISSDQRTLHLIYVSGGCLLDDARAVVDTGTPGEVRIRLLRTELVPEDYELCTLERRRVLLRVGLAQPLAGRRVIGDTRRRSRFRGDEVPRVVGFHSSDAKSVLRAGGLPFVTTYRRTGVVREQFPRPGTRTRVKTSVLLFVTRYEPDARLAIEAPDQTIGAVLRRGLRFRYALNPEVEASLSARLTCSGHDAGLLEIPVRRARGRARVRLQSIRAVKLLRRRQRVGCRLTAVTYPADSRGGPDYVAADSARITLRAL